MLIAALTVALAMAQTQTQPAPAIPAPTTQAAAQPPVAADPDPVIVSAGAVTLHKSDFEASVKTLPAGYDTSAIAPAKQRSVGDNLRLTLPAAKGLGDTL